MSQSKPGPLERSRLILDLYWGSADRRTITAAAEFARLLGLDLLGVYVEDEAVHGLAGLPFAREFKLPGHEWGAIEAEGIAAEFRHAAMSAQRMLVRTAEALGVASAFEVMRGGPTASVTRHSRPGDIMVFAGPGVAGEHTTVSFIRLWQAALNSSASVLLLPLGLSSRDGPVAAVVTRGDDPVLSTAARIALAAGEDLLLLIAESGRGLVEGAIAAARSLGLAEKQIRTRMLPGASTAGILHALADCPERLLVLDRSVLTGPDEAILAIATHCGVPVLILDGEKTAGK